MKQFIYRPDHAGLADWPSGTLRLEGIETTEDQREADIFVIPGSLTSSEPKLFPNRRSLERLPYFREFESRHVAFDCSDNEPLYDSTAMFIRCNTRKWYLHRDPNTISWPWPVAEFKECIPVPPEGFTYDVSCHHWRSTRTRARAAAVIGADARLKSDIVEYRDFTGYKGTPGHRDYDQVEFDRRWHAYRASLTRSRIALCGESIPGVLPYRFLEAMSAGRVPLLVGSGYVLPFADEIPYAEFILTCEADDAERAHWVAHEFVGRNTDAQIIEKGLKARHYWEKWLNREDYPRTMAYAVTKKIEAMKACA